MKQKKENLRGKYASSAPKCNRVHGTLEGKQTYPTSFSPTAAWSPGWEEKGSFLFLDGRAYPIPGPSGGAPALLPWSAPPTQESPGATPPTNRNQTIADFQVLLNFV